MKEIVAKAFIAASLLDVLGMHQDQTAREVQEFIKAHPELDAAIMQALDLPETEAVITEIARTAAREVLELLKKHVSEAA
ncbi:hypothetical protein WK15_23070 [Burkholderia ubonensis]|uniref:hypothetical protein n=1 Tax=Burkholderia ubonensis TaxID=101571 RepID=UPI00075ABA96|nr:hypothetical protein [Burkholderia ubonensis]KVR22984.1 hypothetical protein WK15_22645 [Burkholderia ubonensis]KVR23059.1 hypothetical protein WK15_23070 [Burkholderia ubonensis]KVV53463.1 hypothetical protein WK82_09060 [Burkholderia ubonensis]KVW25599.1 hypothetical protein WK92_08460 [Burkholderia ubonensis]KWI30189.1 hypothetical protein WM04_19220 [Burkholderia ubonensis]